MLAARPQFKRWVGLLLMWATAYLLACGQSPGGSERSFEAAGGASTLAEACLPQCILELFADCPFDGRCSAEGSDATTNICYENGVRAVREVQAPGKVVWTYTKRDGKTPCATKTQTGNDYDYVRINDGKTVRMTVVSRDLRTAFCADGTRTGVYPLPKCAALETIECDGTLCP